MENKTNTLSVSVHLVNGGSISVLEAETAHNAIENYLYPDCRPPVACYTMSATDDNGRTVIISIANGVISITDVL
jgi:hypothetical protein